MQYRVAVDAMGGDHAPEAVVRGAIDAVSNDENLEVVLVGESSQIESILGDCDGFADRLRTVHAAEAIAMEDHPIESLRRKTDSSLLRMVGLASSGEVDAVVSAGNTGAFAAACQLKLRPLGCVSRPGIAVTIPTFFGPIILCDAGANIHAKPHHLYEYAVMASLYAELLLGVEQPRVALLSIGAESGKGTELVRQAHELLKADDRIGFVGNLEGRDLFNDVCDVAVCDGFVGNIVLKLAEGMAEGLFQTIGREIGEADSELSHSLAPVMERVRTRHDYCEYGGAPLLGIDGTCIIGHGRSNARAIHNAVVSASRFLDLGFGAAIEARMGSVGAR